MRLANCALTQSSLKRFGAPIRTRRCCASNVAGVSGLIQAENCCGGNSARSWSMQACQNAAPSSAAGSESGRSASICGVSSIIMSRLVRSGRPSSVEVGGADRRSGTPVLAPRAADACASFQRDRPREHAPTVAQARLRRSTGSPSCRPFPAPLVSWPASAGGGRTTPRSRSRSSTTGYSWSSMRVLRGGRRTAVPRQRGARRRDARTAAVAVLRRASPHRAARRGVGRRGRILSEAVAQRKVIHSPRSAFRHARGHAPRRRPNGRHLTNGAFFVFNFRFLAEPAHRS